MTDIDLAAANSLAAEALAPIKTELAVPPRPAADPNAEALLDAAEDLNRHLALWADRGTDRHVPGVTRQSATHAVTTVDWIVAHLHWMRDRLAGQMRAYDDATAARVDALLAERAADSSDTEGDETDG